VDFGPISLGEIDARVQREAAEERIGAIAEARRETGIAGKGHPHWHKRHERLEAFGGRHVALDAHERWVERGRAWFSLGWNIGAADAAFAVGQRELRWVKPGLGDDRGIACGGTLGGAVDDGESLRLAALYRSSERSTSARRAEGSRFSGALTTLAVVNGASEGRALKFSPDSSIGWGLAVRGSTPGSGRGA
jgi:hypothetical protein